jgi:hypothetical protein
MRVLLAALLLVSGAAIAAPVNDPDTPRSGHGPDAAPGPVVADGHGDRGGRGAGPGTRGGHRPDAVRGGGHPGRHHSGVFFPYPTVWPYPPYPYGPYYYPYPSNYTDDDDDAPSTRGVVVPGDMPVGAVAYWYYCDAPDGFYPYVRECSHDWNRIAVSPPPPGIAAPISFSDWQWCEEKHGFFPYVTACPSGFVAVPVTAPGRNQAGPPEVANWYFCAQPRGYSPYVVQCGGDWRAVPAVPPPSPQITVRPR